MESEGVVLRRLNGVLKKLALRGRGNTRRPFLKVVFREAGAS
jgi:hypothetical protein